MNTKKMFSEKELRQITDRLDALKQDLRNSELREGEKILDNYALIKLFNISKRTSTTWRSSKILPFSKIGRRVFFRLSDIERMLEEHRVGR